MNTLFSLGRYVFLSTVFKLTKYNGYSIKRKWIEFTYQLQFKLINKKMNDKNGLIIFLVY